MRQQDAGQEDQQQPTRHALHVLASQPCGVRASLEDIGYFSKQGRPSRNLFLHVVAPVVGLAAFVLPLYTQYFNLAELFNGNLFVWAHRDPATGASEFLSKTVPATWSVMCALLWVAIGIALSFYLHAMRPDALTRATHSFGGEVD